MKEIKMNQMKNTISICVLLAALFMSGCEEFEKGVPVSKNDIAPLPISEVQVENISGGATLSYTLPKSESLLYVMAEYSRRDGVVSTKKSSYYNNSITLEGFSDEKTYEVKLYAVSRGGKKSDPVIVSIQPLTPPVNAAFQSISMAPTFGGVLVSFKNESEADIKINVLTTDSLGDLYTVETYYTKRKEGNFSVRGFDSLARDFGVFVRDRWDNFSDTLFQEHIPLFERKLDKSKFKELHLPGDNWMPFWGRVMSRIWDETYNSRYGQFASENGHGFPQSFAFDLGVETELSRFKYFPRADSRTYRNIPRLFEIWGSTDPNPDGSWDSWTKIRDCEFIKPSGLPGTEFTQEDQEYAANGVNYEFPPGTPPVRYIRFKTLEVFAEGNIAIWELTFWGAK